MGGPGSGRRKSTGRAGLSSAKTPQQYAKRAGISVTAAKTVFAKKESLRKANIRRAKKRTKAESSYWIKGI